MNDPLKNRKLFIFLCLFLILESILLSYIELPSMKPHTVTAYLIAKGALVVYLIFFLWTLIKNKFVKTWNIFFHIMAFLFIGIGHYFGPGSHLVVIQYLYISAIIFQGLTLWPIVISILFILMYRIHPFSQMHFPDYPYLHSDVYNGIISAIIVSLLLERYVTRYKNRQEVLDRKIKYKGVKTDIFLHDLKNQIQIAMSKTDDAENFQGILKSIQNFNSTMKTDSVSFIEVIEKLKIKMEFKVEIEYEGSEEFLIDQMDLESILTNLIKSTIKHADKQTKVAKIKIYGRESGFNYQDNIVFENQEYYKIVNLADVTSYPDFIKDNRMLYMTKKLVEYHGGIFTMEKKTNGSYIEINY